MKTLKIQRLGYFIKSNYFPRVSLLGVFFFLLHHGRRAGEEEKIEFEFELSPTYEHFENHLKQFNSFGLILLRKG